MKLSKAVKALVVMAVTYRQKLRLWCRTRTWWPAIHLEWKGMLIGNMKFIEDLSVHAMNHSWAGYPSSVPFGMVTKLPGQDPVVIVNFATMLGNRTIRQYILAHEHGHIECGHVSGDGGGLLTDPKIEFEADLVAARTIGSSKALLGLSKYTLALFVHGASGDGMALVNRIHALRRLVRTERSQERSALALDRLLQRNTRIDTRLAA
jgi:hypothetical protein